jgi:hypothetical protein
MRAPKTPSTSTSSTEGSRPTRRIECCEQGGRGVGESWACTRRQATGGGLQSRDGEQPGGCRGRYRGTPPGWRPPSLRATSSTCRSGAASPARTSVTRDTRADATPAPSFVEIGRQPLSIALRLVVIDPKLSFFLGHNVGQALHGGSGLLFVEVDVRNTAVVPVLLKVDGVA